MANLNRYAATIDVYIYATSDADAIKQAVELADEMKSKEDNQAEVINLDETPFASLKSRNIFSK